MEPETKARAPERALRQYLAHALEQPQPNCTRSAGCLDRFLAKGLDNFPPSPPLKAKPSRCLLFEQLLSGCRRKQERLLVPDLATNWFRKQKIYVDKLSAEELAALSSGLASRDESHCLEDRKCPEQPRRCPDGGGLVSAECLPITGPKSRNPFLMDSGATLEERQTNCLLGSKDTTKEGSRDCLSPRRTEPMLNRRKNDLRKAPHRRLDPAAFRRISPEFFCLLDAYETAMSESCPLYGIPMDSWDERKVSSVEEEAWQKQHCLGDEAVATAVVSPYRLAGQNSRPPEEEVEDEEMQLEKASSKWREDQEDREDGEEKLMKQEMENERRNSKKRRVSLVSQEPQQEQEWKDIQPCNSETCSARGEMVSFCSYQERPRRRYKTQNSLSNYSSVRSGYEEERQLELQQKQEQLKQQQEQIQLEQQEKQEKLKQQQEQLQMELQEKQEQLKEQQEQLKQQQEQLVQQQQQLQEQLEGTAAAPKRPAKTPKKRRCNWCSCFRPSTTMQFRNAYSNAYLPGLYAQAPPKPRLLRTPSLPPAPLSSNLYLMPHQRLPPTASSLYTPLSSGCTLCSASNRKKHILGGLTGLCKRVTNPGRHLLYNLHHNRAKYAKQQQIQPKRHLTPQEGLDQAGVPQLFISTPAPCTWKKVKRKLPETDKVKEIQAEDSTTTLKPSVYEKEEEQQQQQQQQEELSKLTSDQSLNFNTPPSECTLAGFPQVPGDSRSSVSFEQEPARTLSITHQCECDWSSRDTQDIPIEATELQQADASGYNHQGQPSRSRKSKPSQAAAYLPNETQESANEELPPRAPKLTMPRRQSLYTLHPFSGFRPRGLHWGNDYQQLMQRVARPRLNNRRIKRKKISDQVAPKTKPKPRVPNQPKPKPTSKPKTKLKPKPKVASATTAPAQNTQDPQPTNDDPPRLCSQQSSMNPIQICRRQSTKTLLEYPSPAQPEPSDCACQNQAESPMSSEQSSMDFVSCVTTSKSQDQRGIPSTESHSNTESQTVTEQSSFVSMVCKCTHQEEISQENPRKCTSTLSEEPSPPKRKITCRSPIPRRRERKQNSYQRLKSLEQPSQGRTTSCGSSSSGGRMQRERSSSNYRQSEASACHRPKRCQDNDRPSRRNATTKTKEVSMASFWSQRRRRPFCSPWADYERSHQSLHSKASSGCSCWPPQESRQNPSQDVPSSRPSFRRRCLPNQWLPPAMACLSSGHASQRSSFETPGQVYNYAPIQPMLSFAPMQPETSFEAAQPVASSVEPSEHITRGRRYYTETQPGRATGNKFSCRSMHTTCSIRALSSNTDSMRCPCAPAPSVASVEPPPEEEEEEQQQEQEQYYRYQEPCPPSPPDSGFKICSNKTSFLKNTMRWEEQEHRYTHTRLRTKRPPPDEYYSSGNNSFYRPEPPSYQRWDNDFYCQPGQESFPDARPWHQPYTYALGHQVQPDFNSDREGAIAAAAQGLRGLVQAMGGPRHRSRHSRCSLDSCYQPQTGRDSSCLYSDWLGHQPQRESLTSGSYYSRGSGAGERTWSSREASAARFIRGSTAKRSAREGRRGPDSGAFISLGSGMDFRGEPFASPRTMCSRSRRRRTGGSSRVKKVEHEQEEKPTALAIFLDELKAKHDATQILSQGRSPPEITERTGRESSSSENCADPSKRMAIPTTYTGLLEEQIINEYLPRPRHKRRT
ncbi:uncharacterized protein [Drosophila kikkawai]|uniref:Serine/arginine repetitive matrix protein 2-like n=1 Tax=Drosophila kikkawai TaxID=30033 RepID=A0A6P4J2M7_DROKI|nr:uncharacterized protein LOC108083771 [Drosophila kikkawai]